MQIELRRLHEMLGMTTVYVTHDQREALTMSDRVVVVNHGKLMQIDEPKQLYESAAQQVRCRLHRRIDLPAGERRERPGGESTAGRSGLPSAATPFTGNQLATAAPREA